MDNRASGPPDLNALAGLASELASTFVALASDIALVIDADGSVRKVVQGRAPMAPAADDWVGRPWADTVTGDTRRKIVQLLDDVHSSGVARQREVNLPGGDGASIPVSYAAIRLGEHGPVLAVGRDLRTIAAIQQRFQESQQEMERDYWMRRQAESRYRMLFQVATDAVLVVDALTLAIVEANAAAAALFDMPAQRLAGQHVTVGIDRHSWPAVEELLGAARATGRAAEIRVRLPGQSGAVDLSATPFRSGNDLLLLVRARALGTGPQAAPDENVRWADLVQRIPDAVVVTDSSGRVLMSNPAFGTLCQSGSDLQVDGRSLSQWIGEPTLSQLLARARRHGIAAQIEATLRSDAGRAIGIAVSVVLLDEGDRECIGFTLRRLDGHAGEPQPAVEEIAAAFEALADGVGRRPLPELLRSATELAERHLIRSAMQRVSGDADAAARLLGIAPRVLAERLQQLAASTGAAGDPSSMQLN